MEGNLRKRILLFLQTVEKSQRELAEMTGYSPQSLSNFFTGNTKSPRGDFFISLANEYPDLNLRWLLTGEGEMWSSEEEVRRQDKAVKNLSVKVNYLKEQIGTLTQENKDLRALIQSKDEIIQLLKKANPEQ